MRTLILAAAGLALSATAAHAGNITFEGFAAGTVIDDEYQASDGLTISVNSNGSVNQAMIFNSNNLTGGDTDLVGPFNTPTVGGVDGYDAGNILIISEDGDSSDPDDEARGGSITFTFDRVVQFLNIDIIDIDIGEEVSLFFSGGNSNSLNLSFPGAAIGNGNYIDLRLTFELAFGKTIEQFLGISGFFTFDTLEVVFSGSGAVNDLEYAEVPLPAALPFLLTGLGGIALARRRRKA